MENPELTQWRCPICETLNKGEFCIVCGEKRVRDKSEVHYTIPEYETYNIKKDINKRRLGINKLAVTIIVAICFVVIFMIGVLFFGYSKATDAMKKGDYHLAKQYLSKINTRDSVELEKECDYQIATQSLNNGDAQYAKSIYDGLGDYKNSADMVMQCDYVSAQWYMGQGQLITAYNLFESLGNYSDSAQKLNELKNRIYEEGIKFYRGGSYDTAEIYFEKSVNLGNEEKYKILIQAHQNPDSVNLETLYSLINFEDTKEILQSDDYIEKFLLGNWSNSKGYYLRFYHTDSGSIRCSFSMPVSPYGEHWKIQNSVQLFGSDDNGWYEYWTYIIIAPDKLDIKIANTGKTYRFIRN